MPSPDGRECQVMKLFGSLDKTMQVSLLKVLLRNNCGRKRRKLDMI
jgi:hypothetical protein